MSISSTESERTSSNERQTWSSFFYRTTYNGHWLSKQITVKPKKQSSFSQSGLKKGEFELPNPAYDGLLPISQAKYDDLQVLKRFCPSAVQQFYENLPH